ETESDRQTHAGSRRTRGNPGGEGGAGPPQPPCGAAGAGEVYGGRPVNVEFALMAAYACGSCSPGALRGLQPKYSPRRILPCGWVFSLPEAPSSWQQSRSTDAASCLTAGGPGSSAARSPTAASPANTGPTGSTPPASPASTPSRRRFS